MSEENKFNNEEEIMDETAQETVEATDETAEEVTEAVEYAAEETTAENDGEAVEENAEEISATEPIEGEAEGETIEFSPVDEAPKSKKTAAIVISAVAVLVIAAVLIFLYVAGYFGMWFNKYNRGYIDTTGRTIGEVAEQSGMKLEEFLEMYGLPKNMPENTYESAAFYTMPVSKTAEVYGLTFDAMKEQLQLPDTVTENDKWGDVEGEITLGVYLGGEDVIDQFKEYYGLGDEVTAETKWKDIRVAVDTKQKEAREEAERKAEEAKNSASPASEDDASNEETEQPESADSDTAAAE